MWLELVMAALVELATWPTRRTMPDPVRRAYDEGLRLVDAGQVHRGDAQVLSELLEKHGAPVEFRNRQSVQGNALYCSWQRRDPPREARRRLRRDRRRSARGEWEKPHPR